MDSETLARAFQTTVAAVGDATAWATDARNARKLAQDRPRIERSLRRTGIEARRLEQTFKKPTCVGVFGPSQAGKSYLISVLARKEGEDAMIAKFDGPEPEIDFITKINPLGGKEATGLVTRFTMRPEPTPPGFPVCLRLLSQSDIVKIIINSYFHDGAQEDETAIDEQELEDHLTRYETLCAASPTDVLGEDDIWDIKEYVTKNSGGASTAKALAAAWERIARIAPKLSISDRTPFFSILWGRHATYSNIFATLLDALARLSFASDAFCAMDSLIPSVDGILNVSTLDGLLDPAAAILQVRAKSGTPVALPKPIITALAMELRIVCRDEPWPFFAFTDLLDFPGYRTRKPENLKKRFRDSPKSAAELFLRGKVDYLFQSYTADLELTSLILCLPDSNLEVLTLPKAIENWIDVTHGSAPDRREGKPTLLFFALTKFDRHLMESAGEEGNQPALRFETRLRASLIEPFGASAASWPNQWTPGVPFKNMFWIRNPNFKAEHVIVYRGRQEVEVIPERLDRIAQLRTAFIGSSLTQTYFRDPPRAWDEAMRLNDGGVSYLADALGVVSTRDLKLRQVGSRLMELRRQTATILQPFYVEDDFVKRRAQRLEVVEQKIFPSLNACAERMAFGSALRGMMVDASDLYAAISEALNRPWEARPAGPFGRRGQTQDHQPDKWARVANAALERWTTMMFERSEDAAFSRRVGVAADAIREMVVEFSAAASRAGLVERIAEFIRQNNSPNEPVDAIARKISLVAERGVNRFVAQLDFDTLDAATQTATFGDDLQNPVFVSRKVQFDTAEMPLEARDFAGDYMAEWGEAFFATVARNAMSATAGVDDPGQNAKLGEILKTIAA